MTYLVSPIDLLTPTDDQGATQGAEELRALKAYLAGLVGFPAGGFNIFRKNGLINADFTIWQRGTPLVGLAALAYHADRWVYDKVGTMVHDFSRAFDVPTVAQLGHLTVFSLLNTCTTADVAIAAADYCRIIQRIEGYDWRRFAQIPCVLSFWVKATKIGIYCVALRNLNADRCFVAEYTVNIADTWEKKTISIPASPVAGTWDFAVSIGISVNFMLAAGTDHHTATPGVWIVGAAFSTVNQVNACDTIGNNFRLAEVQFESGTVVTPFEHRSITDEIKLCERYFQKSYSLTTPPGTIDNSGQSVWRSSGALSNQIDSQRPLRTRMRVFPTMTFYNPITGIAGTVRNDSTGTNFTIAGTGSAGETSTGSMDLTAAPGDNDAMSAHWSANAEL